MSNPAFLIDGDFRALAKGGAEVVSPFEEEFVQAASIDLRLSGLSYRYRFDSYSLGQEVSEADYAESEFGELSLSPGESCFVGIEETIRIPSDCLGFIFARSSITRLGITIPPVFMNPGYSGRPPLTIINSANFPVKLIPRVRVAQLVCARLSASPKLPYDAAESSKYVDEDTAPSRLHTDEEIAAALDRVLRNTLPAQMLLEA
ncbi:dCTP deaminase [Aurantimonas coralicida]|uniref:dCTP deaminase n=1 Tax=Aurantimonas coralicida TaxID=182270 RepID=UPI001E307EEA|nr:dCTP deaminase [Aurantimonas coralicida]MCD1644804.1 dCTP deaminase [Aurantimonas coralicida]